MIQSSGFWADESLLQAPGSFFLGCGRESHSPLCNKKKITFSRSYLNGHNKSKKGSEVETLLPAFFSLLGLLLFEALQTVDAK